MASIGEMMRQQSDWEPWAALTNTTNARYSAQVIAASNAGTAKSTVLRALRRKALKRIEEQAAWAGDPIEYAAEHDVTLGLFEWSGPDDERPILGPGDRGQ